ncbi:hypothetical protein FANTH_4547 [Fusarium anthophilum]|uniref:Uncharacterized protein n=1 Tax=Fusarium anthophilum TaxID=48485 RepID=A0A8H5E819_9HYPO|nr:hypothetical protein FANTH_4547 [Fusarium anthophilum]
MDEIALPSPAPTYNDREEALQVLTEITRLPGSRHLRLSPREADKLQDYLRLDRLEEDDHVVHSTEYKMFTDREGKARTDVAYGYSHRPKRKRDEFPLPKFPDQIESRITTAQARAFLNELTADTRHFGQKIKTFSGKGAAALLGPYVLHPGRVKFKKYNHE